MYIKTTNHKQQQCYQKANKLAVVGLPSQMKDCGESQLLSAEVQFGLAGATGDQYTNIKQLKILTYKDSMERPYQSN